MARWFCVGLIVLGLVVAALDFADYYDDATARHRAEVRAGRVTFSEWARGSAAALDMSYFGLRHQLWKWGAACLIAGVLGLVALEVARAGRKGGGTT